MGPGLILIGVVLCVFGIFYMRTPLLGPMVLIIAAMFFAAGYGTMVPWTNQPDPDDIHVDVNVVD